VHHVATIAIVWGNLNDPQLFQTGYADFFESTFDNEAVPFHEGSACEAAGNLSLAGNRDINLQWGGWYVYNRGDLAMGAQQ
jgi:hypothetical protein